MNFDDREKKQDRRFNRTYLDFRKFVNEDTCPTCNISPVMRAARDYKFSGTGKGVIKIKWVHDVRNCFSWYATILLVGRKDRFGKYLTPKNLQKMIDSGFRMMNQLDKKFTEKGK